MTSARTEWNTTVARPDGSTRLTVSTEAVRARKGAGWAKVDNTIRSSGGVLKVASAVTPMTFSDGSGDEPFATIERDGHQLAFDVPFDLPKPSVDDERVTYDDVLPGVDLIVTVNDDATGFSEVLRVQSARAAANPRLAKLRFALEASGGLKVRAEDGGFATTDATGAQVFTSPVPAMWDSKVANVSSAKPDAALGQQADLPDVTVEPAGGAVAAIPATLTGDQVSITPDAAMLTSPATVWPVYIDPSLSGTLNRHSAVRTVFGTKYDFPGDEGVGLCNKSDPYGSSCSSTFKSRLLYQFSNLQALGNLDEADVSAATFSVVGAHSYNCTPQPVGLYSVGDFDQSTAYPAAGWTLLDSKTVAHRSGCTNGQVPRVIEFSATAQAKNVARANTSLASFGIMADESSMAYWKRYDANATFAVTYNRAPSAPVSPTVTDTSPLACTIGSTRPYVRTKTPTLNAVLSDPDNTNVQGVFKIVNTRTNASWTAPTTGAQASGQKHSVQIPAGILATDDVYGWTVTATDGSRSGPTSICEFTVDTTRPAKPVVTTVSGTNVSVYPLNARGTQGGLGAEGRFQFSNAGSTDVVKYRYTIAGTTAETDKNHAIVPFVPKTVGSVSLEVEAVDAAGNIGDKVSYGLWVPFPTMSDAWMLDALTGGTTAGVVASGAGPLTVSPSTVLVDGPGRDPKVVTAGAADKALRFVTSSDTAKSAGPVVATDKNYAVMAFIKLEDLTTDATAVSQGGSQASAFELGYRTTGCPTATGGHCWAFSVPGVDSVTPAATTVYSAIPARANSWVLLTGIREAGTISVSACEIVSPSPRQSTKPEQPQSVAAPPGWSSNGSLQLGQAKAAGAPARYWHGSVSQVVTFRNMVSDKPGESTAAGYFFNKAARICPLPWNLATTSGVQELDAVVPPAQPGQLPPIPDTVEHDTPVYPAPHRGDYGFDLGYIGSLYTDVLRRGASPSEVSWWVDYLGSANGNYAEVATGIVGSQEWKQKFVADSYVRYLRRGADPSGLTNMVNILNTTGNALTVEVNLVGSQEYYNVSGGNDRAFVAQLYRDVLGREAGPDEITSWASAIPSAGITGVANGIVASEEHANRLLERAYATVLGRGLDPAGAGTFRPMITNGGHLDTVIASLAASEEYLTYRVRAY